MKAAVRKHYAVKSFDRRITFRFTPDIIRRVRDFNFTDKRLKEMGFSPASVTRAVALLTKDEESARDAARSRPELEAMAAFMSGYGD